jgi:hypothetical protein
MLMKIFDYRKTCLSTHHRLREIKLKMTPVKAEPVLMDDNGPPDNEPLLVPIGKEEEIKEEVYVQPIFVNLKIEAMPPSQSRSDGAEEPMVKEPKPTGEKPKSGRRLAQCPECGAMVQQRCLKGDDWRRLVTGVHFSNLDCNL